MKHETKMGIFGAIAGVAMFGGLYAAAGAFVQPAHAGAWEKISGFFADTVPSKMFAIEAQGFNLRGYAFSLEKEGKTCLFVAGEKKGGLTCWDSK